MKFSTDLESAELAEDEKLAWIRENVEQSYFIGHQRREATLQELVFFRSLYLSFSFCLKTSFLPTGHVNLELKRGFRVDIPPDPASLTLANFLAVFFFFQL